MRASTLAQALVAFTLAAPACQPKGDAESAATTDPEPSAMKLSSTAFGAAQPIPRRYTCEGDDRSPPLAWHELPAGTKSLALIVDDPDAPDPAAPKRTWVHWVLYDIPPQTAGLPEAVTAATLPPGTREGENDWKRTGYGGPCPPIGRHRYFHRLYALDVVLGDRGPLTRAELDAAIKGHILAKAELMGTYQKEASE